MNYNVIASTTFGPMIVNRFDRVVGFELSTRGVWEPEEVGLLINILQHLLRRTKRKVTILDLGANYGAISIPIAKAVGERGQVIAFEAQRIIYYALAGNVALSSLENLYCLHRVISDEAGSVQIAKVQYDQAGHFGGFEVEKPFVSDFNAQLSADSESVDALAIDSLELNDVVLMKIDVEGMELKALKGAINTIKRCNPVLYVEHCKSDAEALKQFLHACQYRIYAAGETNWLAVPLSNVELRVQGTVEIK